MKKVMSACEKRRLLFIIRHCLEQSIKKMEQYGEKKWGQDEEEKETNSKRSQSTWKLIF